MANRSIGVRAWEATQQMETAYIAGQYDKVVALSAMAQAYQSFPATTEDDALSVWFSHAAVANFPQRLSLTVETVTNAAAPTDAEVTWDMGDSASRAVTNKALTTNVATLTFAAAHNLLVGMKVLVAISDAVFDGLQTITGVTATTITFAKVNANVTAAAATGTAKLAGLTTTYDWAVNGTKFVVVTVDTAALGAVAYGRNVKVPYAA